MKIEDLLYDDYYIATLRDDFVVCQVTYSDRHTSSPDSKYQIQGRVIFSNFYTSPFHNIVGETNMTIKKITKETYPEYFL